MTIKINDDRKFWNLYKSMIWTIQDTINEQIYEIREAIEIMYDRDEINYDKYCKYKNKVKKFENIMFSKEL